MDLDSLIALGGYRRLQERRRERRSDSSHTDRNYDMGNRELLAVKMALEEWRHWLEGAEHPFLVWTDHINLEYLCITKLLNSKPAR